MTLSPLMHSLGLKAKQGARSLAGMSTEAKNCALSLLSKNLIAHEQTILDANAKDLEAARQNGVTEALLDRLSLKGRLHGIAQDVLQVAKLADPVGEVFDETVLANGLRLSKLRTPIGVLGVIYEARPNVTIDIAALTIKTGNGVILRGGSETLQTNLALVDVIHRSLTEAGLSADSVQFIDHPDRKYVQEMLHAYEFIDLIIPRGGASLHQYCREHSTIPVITGGIGICHLFVDESADFTKSLKVITNAKTQKTSACNALDTVLVHEKIAASFIPLLIETLSTHGVTFPLSPEARSYIKTLPVNAHLAQPGDWDTEWLGLTLGIHVVPNLDAAIAHIQKHSMGHSDGILTEDHTHAEKFIKEVDSACVYVNASTRFSDGGQFGLGAEVAISTQKIHARGPMALRELTSYKWIGRGNYHIRD